MSVIVDAPEDWPAPPPAAPDRLARWAGIVTVGVCALTPVLAYLGNLGFAVLIGLAGALCLPLAFRNRRPSLGLCLAVALAAWAVVSMQWSVAAQPHPDFSHHRAIGQLTALKLLFEVALYSAFVVATVSLSQAAGARATLVLGIGLALLAVLFMVDAILKAPIYQFVRTLVHQTARPDLALRDMSRASYVMSLLFWPAAVRFGRAWMRLVAAGLVVATLIGAYVLNADAPFATLAVSGVVFAAVRWLGRPALIVLLAGVVLYFLGAPVLISLVDHGQMLHPAPDDIREQSWAIRLDIWRFAAARIHERPFLGWGLDAARTFSPNIPLHTHNAAMQIWLELGAVGAILTCLFWSWIVLQIDRLEAIDRPTGAACAAAAAAYLTIGALSFGVWQEWWLALGALTAAVCIALARGAWPAAVEPRRTARSVRPLALDGLGPES